MTLEDFVALHVPALEAAGEARHNLMLGILAGTAGAGAVLQQHWTLGGAGSCAIETTKQRIVLGDLARSECARLAEDLREAAFAGVVGTGQTAIWFADHAEALGMKFSECMPQQILALERPPRFPGAPGSARAVGVGDAALFADWRIAFTREATPYDPVPARAAEEKIAANGNHMMWIVGGAPVSLASIGRRTRNGIVVNGVYTPPTQRGRGYAGSLVAALAERGRAEGKRFACLYVDRRNPASNRCYEKIGFAPVCDAWYCVRG